MDIGIVSAGCPPVVNAWKNGDTEDQLQSSHVKGIDEFVVGNNEESRCSPYTIHGMGKSQAS